MTQIINEMEVDKIKKELSTKEDYQLGSGDTGIEVVTRKETTEGAIPAAGATYFRKETIDEIKEEICDEYCRFPLELDADLDEICKECPMNRRKRNMGKYETFLKGNQIIITTIKVPIRKHRKRRIQKKWLKQYGYVKIEKQPEGKIILYDNKLYMTEKDFDLLKKAANQTRKKYLR